MASPQLSVTAASALTLPVEVIVIGATAGKNGPTLVADEAFAEVRDGILANLVTFGFSGRADELLRLPAVTGMTVSLAVIGLGSEVSARSLRLAAGSATRQLAGNASVGLAFGITDDESVLAIAEGAGLGSYSFTKYRTKTAAKAKNPVTSIVIASNATVTPAALSALSAVDASVRLVRDLINTSGADMFPDALAQLAVNLTTGTAITAEVWDETRLAAEGCGGIVGVGQGSSRPPRLVKLSYTPAGATKHVAFVGKGITYDTGGYSLKPADGMLGMHSDMGGAATLLGLMLAAAETSVNVRLTAWLCIAENLVSSTAIRPNDVLTIRGGTTVEVLNTDAEGRLVMADGLVLASEEHPDALIDIATLTGAQIVALGNRTVGVMGDDALVATIVAAGTAVGEPHWAMPLPEELRPSLDSRFADIANVKPGNRAAGMLMAGVFLREFVGTGADGETTIPWAHLDIAGPSVNDAGAYGYLSTGATGVSLRTLLVALKSFAS
jgi:leucyl aminopeptidase